MKRKVEQQVADAGKADKAHARCDVDHVWHGGKVHAYGGVHCTVRQVPCCEVYRSRYAGGGDAPSAPSLSVVLHPSFKQEECGKAAAGIAAEFASHHVEAGDGRPHVDEAHLFRAKVEAVHEPRGDRGPVKGIYSGVGDEDGGVSAGTHFVEWDG
ncbi:hypothetical protein DDE01_10660 [Desulfovibrio desulfuricans]|nr:hypothetical protein DDE01_10660 [Desulfovibrio desulfuricans]